MPFFFIIRKKEKRFMENILKRLDGETENQTLWRIGNAKAAGLMGNATWVEVAEFMNKTYREDEAQYYDSSAYRKRYKNFSDAYEELFSKENFTDEQLVDIEEKMRELEKAKIKLRDERIDYQKSIREDARRESFIELIERAMAINVEPFDYKTELEKTLKAWKNELKRINKLPEIGEENEKTQAKDR